MSYYKPTTDASDQYRPTTSVATAEADGTAVAGNLFDMMKNAVIEEVYEEVDDLEYAGP